MSRLSRLVAPAIVALLVSSSASAQQRAAILIGNVLADSTDRPIAGAEILIPSQQLLVFSDSLGHFRIGPIAAGRHLVSVRKIGYAPSSAMITFHAVDSSEADFVLVPLERPGAILAADTVVGKSVPLAAKLIDFERRRANGIGHFLSSAQIAKLDQHLVSEILMSLPGPKVYRGASSAAWVAGGRGARSNTLTAVSRADRIRGAPETPCWAAVRVDGVLVYSARPGEGLFDVNSVPASEIVGMEFYNGSSDIPPEFSGARNTCGLLLIWTK
ncbi:MAG: carboxypeptidase-like regulatory domain-containing protein [Gemmatimonadota bacterium]|nr:carboxypeptidase-like regulatory domain-containing protein [Gemmatimonadota bacterium]